MPTDILPPVSVLGSQDQLTYSSPNVSFFKVKPYFGVGSNPKRVLEKALDVRVEAWTKKKGLESYLSPGLTIQTSADHKDKYQNIESCLKNTGAVPIPFQSLQNGVNLSGYWLPSREESTKTVVLVHGHFGNATMMFNTAKHITDHLGWNAFIFDLRGHGKSVDVKIPTKDFHPQNTTSFGFHEGKDIAGAVAYLKDRFSAVESKIVILAFSMGASALLMAPASLNTGQLNDLSKNIDGVILDSPFLQVRLDEERLAQDAREYLPKAIRGLSFLPLKKRIAASFEKNFDELIFPWLQEHFVPIVENFLNKESQELLALPFPVSNFNTAKMFVEDSKLSNLPMMLLYGERDNSINLDEIHTIVDSMNKVRQKKDIEPIVLDADHTNANYSNGNRNLNGKSTISTWRDPDTYAPALEEFLKSI